MNPPLESGISDCKQSMVNRSYKVNATSKPAVFRWELRSYSFSRIPIFDCKQSILGYN